VRSIAIMLAVATAMLISVSVLQYEQLRAMRSMDATFRIVWHVPQGDEMTTTWISGGTQHSVTTNHSDNWTLAQWQTRHFNAVATEQKTYPPDGL
jgi:hypothetical protein